MEKSEAFLKALAEFEAGRWLLMVSTLSRHLTPDGLNSVANRFHDPNLPAPAAPFKSVLKMKNPLPMLCIQPGYLHPSTDSKMFLDEFQETVERCDSAPSTVFSPALRHD